jgi:malate dehydrogenase (oxaloacetate-decarboxylating)
MAAVSVTKSKLSDQRIVIYGAGSAGLGIAHQLRDALCETDGMNEEEANKLFWLIDKDGLLTEDLAKKSKLRQGLDPFIRPAEEWKDAAKDVNGLIPLLEVVKRVKPTVLIGTSTHAGAFDEHVVREMSKGVKRPIIFPLSNPSRLAEVNPKDANEWSGDMALLATGSPFPAVKMKNGRDYM